MARRGARRQSGLGRIVGIAVLTALVAGAGLLAFAPGRGGTALTGVATDVSGAIGGVLAAPVRWGQAIRDNVRFYFGAVGLSKKLQAENEALLQWRDQAKAATDRLAAFEKLYGIAGERLPKGLSGRMIAETAGPFSRAGIVNLGKKSGVAVNWIVLNQYGLVGRVISVGDRSARVLLLDDGDSRLPVMGEVTRARAIMQGDKSEAPKLVHLNSPPILREGEGLMTSGDDGIVPRGIAVGVAGKAPDGNWRVRLANRIGPIDFVRLVPPSNFPAPPDPVTPPDLNPPPPPAPVDAAATAAGAVLPLAPGAAAVPVAATPEAIRAAQAEATKKINAETEKIRAAARKLEAERDAAREAARKADAARIAAERKAAGKQGSSTKSATSSEPPPKKTRAEPVPVPMTPTEPVKEPPPPTPVPDTEAATP